MSKLTHNIDFMAIGDVVTDAFIQLLPAEAEVETDNKKHPLLCMAYGTKIPFSNSVVIDGVGNAANAAVAASRLGLHTAFMSNVGDDSVGEDILLALYKNKISTEFVRKNTGYKSNYHYVLWYGADRTILIKHEKYEYKWPTIHASQKPLWIYLSSIAENGEIIHQELERYLAQNPDVNLAFQPGTFQIRAGRQKLAKLYARAGVFAANKEEFQEILGSKSTSELELIKQMHAIGPKVVLLTDGPKGAFGSDGKVVVSMPPYPDPAPPVDRTGAGDSYASTFTVAYLGGKSLADSMAWAGVNSMSVVQQIGAQAGLLTEAQIRQWLKKAPASYGAKRITMP